MDLQYQQSEGSKNQLHCDCRTAGGAATCRQNGRGAGAACTAHCGHGKLTTSSLGPHSRRTPRPRLRKLQRARTAAQLSNRSRWKIGRDSWQEQQHSSGSSSAHIRSQLCIGALCTWNELHSVDPGVVPLQRMHQPAAAWAAPRSVQAQPPAVPFRPAAGRFVQDTWRAQLVSCK